MLQKISMDVPRQPNRTEATACTFVFAPATTGEGVTAIKGAGVAPTVGEGVEPVEGAGVTPVEGAGVDGSVRGRPGRHGRACPLVLFSFSECCEGALEHLFIGDADGFSGDRHATTRTVRLRSREAFRSMPRGGKSAYLSDHP